MRLLLIALLLIVPAGAAVAQTIPRTPDGRPDFQGVWDSHSITPLERPAGVGADRLVVSAEQEQAIVAAIMKGREAFPFLNFDAEYPLNRHLATVRGEYRTSRIIEPSDGKLPYSAAGRALRSTLLADVDKAEGPESRTAGERCLGGPGFAPMTLQVGGAYRQIVQTADHLVIWTEHHGDLRILRLNPAGRASQGPDGVSVATWDGDVLVVETTSLPPGAVIREGGGTLLAPPDGKVIERFELVSPSEIVYTFTVEADVYERQWRGEFSLHRTNVELLEFACHEGNYAMEGILKAARVAEQRTAAAKPAPQPASKGGKP